MNRIELKTNELLMFHSGCHGNQVPIGTHRTKVSKRGGRSNAWSPSTLKTQCKNKNESIFESDIHLQKAFRVDEVQCTFDQIF